jgi:hypothetical protein
MLSIFLEPATLPQSICRMEEKSAAFFAGLISLLGRGGGGVFPLYNLMREAGYLCRVSAQRFFFAFHP